MKKTSESRINKEAIESFIGRFFSRFGRDPLVHISLAGLGRLVQDHGNHLTLGRLLADASKKHLVEYTSANLTRTFREKFATTTKKK